MFCQQDDVVSSFPEWRNVKLYGIYAVEEILAELPFVYHGLKI